MKQNRYNLLFDTDCVAAGQPERYANWPMKTFIGLFTFAAAFAAVGANQDVWTPKAEFQLEKSDLRETMLFVSGMAYGLTAYSQELKSKERLFCIPGRGLVQSPMLFDILNAKHAGQTITAEQATSTILAGLRDRFPCK